MNIAIADLLFAWPPRGGADVDIYHVAQELQRQGHTLHLHAATDHSMLDRSLFDSADLPFPAILHELPKKRFGRDAVVVLSRSIEAQNPDVVVVADAFFLKPRLIHALGHFPLISRYYAHETACHRDILRFKDGRPCPNDYLHTPEVCRHCALEHLGPEIKRGVNRAWSQEYLLAQAYQPEYLPLARQALGLLHAAIVSNEGLKAEIEPWCTNIAVIPGGVDIARFAYAPPEERPSAKVRILLAGRAEDPAKGLAVLMEAGEQLARERSDFEIQVTLPEDTVGPGWFRPVGWLTHDETRQAYQDADICVVPSVWEEPFGLVALEAMAVGRPVCASRVGGLKEIVVHDETGFLFERGDSAELASRLALLLDNSEQRRGFGDAGRKRVEQHYTWPEIVRRHYIPLLESVAARATGEEAPAHVTASVL